jgi:hypothetical protein
MARGRKKRTNIRKQVVRNPATLAQTIRRRVLLTAGSGVDSTTTDGGLPAGLAAAFGAGGASLAGGAGTPEPCWFTLLSTSSPRFCDRDHIDERSHFNAAGLRANYTITRDTGNDISVKPNLPFSLEVRSQLKIIKVFRQKALYTFSRKNWQVQIES